ncbi:MAG: hypothetical protein ACP5RH_13995 [Leptodesmis sp.]|uniref:hypothetical protein n=1 Tax=Leptodesmis sp. TaxID=3100501 RepID=UPI003D0C3976
MLSINQFLQKQESWLRASFRLLLLILGLLQIWAYRNSDQDRFGGVERVGDRPLFIW